MQSRTIDRVLHCVLLEWVSDIGRFTVRLLSLNKIDLPKTDAFSSAAAIKAQKGFVRAVTHIVKLFVIDMLYFFVGLVSILAIFFATLYMLAKALGPIPPIHEW